MRHVCWFSCGAASAVAAKLTVEKYGEDAEVAYCDTMASEHPDNGRFFLDVQRWIGRPITVLHSSIYGSIDDVFERTRYMAGISGARCTMEMKKAPRIAYQRPTDIHVFGYTLGETKRAETFERNNPELQVEWVLIDAQVSKFECMQRLAAAGIALPKMYALGFDHNNCIACVKATSAGYWNRTRKHFPNTFAIRARQSRAIGARLVRVNGQRVFLDELPPEADAPDEEIECGPACQTTKEN